MIKEVIYSGYATEPSDYECPDGQLATALNLINEDGRLKPTFQPATMLTLQAGQKLWFIHDVKPEKNYIVQDTVNSLFYFFNFDTATKTKTRSGDVISYKDKFTTVYGVNAIGNVLLILTDTGTWHILWKTQNGTTSYKVLGTHIPELTLSFGLQGKTVVTPNQADNRTDSPFVVDIKAALANDTDAYGEHMNAAGDMTDEASITATVLAQVNKFIREQSVNKGKFMYPFFVRYAYRLFDGSLTMQSAPILMYCCDGCNPVVTIDYKHYDVGLTDWKCHVRGMVFDIDMMATLNSQIEELKEWEDIVKSVDVFITSPIYTYDQAGKCKSNVYTTTRNFSFIASVNNGTYKKQKFFDVWDRSVPTDDICVGIPTKSTDSVKEDLKDASNFYLLKSYKLDELPTSRTKIDVKEDYLQSLAERERLGDDYDSHDMLISKMVYPYNSRVNFANITKECFCGFSLDSMGCFTNDNSNLRQAWVYIRQGAKEIVVKSMACTYYGDVIYFYYPNSNAYKAVIKNGSTYRVYNLQIHPMLNGAYYFKAFAVPTETTTEPKVTADDTIPIENKIYTSQVNNPFYFPVANINTVSNTKVIAMSSAAKALSQGQFGQFPLYAFTDEGIWALEVSSTGTYSAKQPITRDVCINPDGILQLDSAVLFPTNRGIMVIAGSETKCITDNIRSDVESTLTNIPYISTLHDMLGHGSDSCMDIKPFLDFLAGCRMVYDYINQRVIVFNPTVDADGNQVYTYAYVYSLKSKNWGLMQSDLASTINAYPEAVAVTIDDKVVSFHDTDEEVCNSLVVTRPLKLDNADILKTVDTVIQRGYFRKGHVAQVLYGSVDLFNWHMIQSSKDQYLRGFFGTPYKYFVVALICKLDKGESVIGCTVQFTPRLTNQPR
jgi:hypothetical protein